MNIGDEVVFQQPQDKPLSGFITKIVYDESGMLPLRIIVQCDYDGKLFNTEISPHRMQGAPLVVYA